MRYARNDVALWWSPNITTTMFTFDFVYVWSKCSIKSIKMKIVACSILHEHAYAMGPFVLAINSLLITKHSFFVPPAICHAWSCLRTFCTQVVRFPGIWWSTHMIDKTIAKLYILSDLCGILSLKFWNWVHTILCTDAFDYFVIITGFLVSISLKRRLQ